MKRSAEELDRDAHVGSTRRLRSRLVLARVDVHAWLPIQTAVQRIKVPPNPPARHSPSPVFFCLFSVCRIDTFSSLRPLVPPFDYASSHLQTNSGSPRKTRRLFRGFDEPWKWVVSHRFLVFALDRSAMRELDSWRLSHFQRENTRCFLSY